MMYPYRAMALAAVLATVIPEARAVTTTPCSSYVNGQPVCSSSIIINDCSTFVPGGGPPYCSMVPVIKSSYSSFPTPQASTQHTSSQALIQHTSSQASVQYTVKFSRSRSVDRTGPTATSQSSGLDTTALKTNKGNGGGLTSGAKTGTGVGVAFGALAVIFAVALYFWRRRKENRAEANPYLDGKSELPGESAYTKEATNSDYSQHGFPAELDNACSRVELDENIQPYEVDGNAQRYEVDGKAQRYELG